MLGLARIAQAHRNVSTLSYRDEVVADAPLGYWRLGEASGTVAADSSGKNHPGTYVSCTQGASSLVPSDPSNLSVTGNGASSQITVGAVAALYSLSRSCAIEALFKPVSVAAGASSGIYSSGYLGICIRQNGTGIEFLRDYSVSIGTVNVGLVAGVAKHIICEIDAAGIASFYADGLLVGTLNVSAYSYSGAYVRLGADGRDAGTVANFLNGTLDEVAVYGHTLGALRIAAHYKALSVPAAARRYWRISIASNNGNANTSIGELGFASSAGGKNLCTGGASYANSVFGPSYAVAYAFDGSLTTRWAADGTHPLPHIIGYQLPSDTLLNEVKVSTWSGSGWLGTDAPKDFSVQSSADSTTGLDGTWKDEWSVSGQVSWSQGETRTFFRNPGVMLDSAKKNPALSLSNFNLTATYVGSLGQWNTVLATIGHNAATANHYFEYVLNSGTNAILGIDVYTPGNGDLNNAAYIGSTATGWSISINGQKGTAGAFSAYGSSWVAGDVIGVLLKNGKLYFRKNGVWQNSADPMAETGWAFSGITGTAYPGLSLFNNGTSATMRFAAATLTGSLPAGTAAW